MKSNAVIGLISILLALLVGAAWSIQQQGVERLREADRFNVPVIEQVMAQLSNWKYGSIKPYLGKKFIQSLTPEEFQNELDGLSLLGKIRSSATPRHVSHARYKHWLYGECAINKYSVSTKFDKGKGVVIINLNHCYKNVEVTFFQVHSRALPTRLPALQ